jgi:hypothetical protein
MESNGRTHMGTITELPEIRSAERAICELCGREITTTNGGRHNDLACVSFERLLDIHMKERHANLCVLPALDERKIAA